MQAGDMPEDISIDIKNAIKTKIKVIKTSDTQDYFEIGLFNPRFTK